MSLLLRRGILSSALSTQGGTFAANTAILDGSTQYFNAPSASELQLPLDSVFAVEWIMEPDDVTSDQDVISKYDDVGGGNQSEWDIRLKSDSKIAMYATDTGGPSSFYININFNYIFAINTRYHVVITSSGSSLSLYVNGSFEQTVAYTNQTPRRLASPFRIGALSRATPIHYFNGEVCFVRKYHVDLTAPQISTLYNSGNALCANNVPAPLPVFSVELANWTGHTSQETDDKSGNGNNLTNVGSIPFTGSGLDVDC